MMMTDRASLRRPYLRSQLWRFATVGESNAVVIDDINFGGQFAETWGSCGFAEFRRRNREP